MTAAARIGASFVGSALPQPSQWIVTRIIGYHGPGFTLRATAGTFTR